MLEERKEENLKHNKKGDNYQPFVLCTLMAPRRGTVVTRWIYFVHAPGSIPSGEAHHIFALCEGYEERDVAFNRFSYSERTRWEPHWLANIPASCPGRAQG